MSKTSAQLLGSLALFFLGLSSPLVSSAQTQTSGAIQGVVYEAGTKQPIAGAIISVTNEETGLHRATITNADGLYFVGILPVGTYTISAQKPGYGDDPDSKANNFPIRLSKTNLVQPPPIVLRRVGTAATPAATPAGPAGAPAPGSSPRDSEDERLVNTVNAARGGNFDRRQLTMLPLPGIRTFDDLAFLVPGVAPPPPPIGSMVGPGIGQGIGTSGQFSVNGARSRANNFTVDGSDNNDEDVGVRRQGFVSLIPQSIESVQEFQISTHLWDAGLGRNLGSQVNAVSRAGGNQVHGTLYDFFNHSALNARNFFDYTSDNAPPLPLTATALARFTGLPNDVQVPVSIFDVVTRTSRAVMQRNPLEGKDPYQRNQGGASIGFPILRDKTLFFASFERQDIHARQETHFSVPTVAQRGLFVSGATGLIVTDRNNKPIGSRPDSIVGDSVFSLFPFPNNPVGPYGINTFTEVLPADAEGTIFSLKLDHNFKLFGPNVAHTLSGRYNFTNDRHAVPAVGDALFATQEPRIGTQNLSLILNSQLTPRISNQIRASYGRTRLRFRTLRDPFLIPSQLVTNDPANGPLLLNARRLFNNSFAPSGRTGLYVSNPTLFFNSQASDAEDALGPVGQVVVTPYSPVGADVYLFPQARTTNAWQAADTLTLFRGHHSLKSGGDLRRTQLNSFQNRNYRPQIVFGGASDLTGLVDQAGLPVPIPNLSRFGDTPGLFSGADLAALGLPTGIFQSLAIGQPDSTIGLRFWQYNFFFNDNWRVRRGLTLDYGLRYEYNTVPREAHNRIEKTFGFDMLPANDPGARVAIVSGGAAIPLPSAPLLAAFDQTLGALKKILDGRQTIYDPDRNNFGPHLGFAWDPFASSTQAGKTVVRGGVGVYYDVTLGSVVSQSRNVFPTFLPLNIDANTFVFSTDLFFDPNFGTVAVFNPRYAPLGGFDSQGNVGLLVDPKTLNTIGVPAGAVRQLLGLIFNPVASGFGLATGGGLAFTLPDRHLRAPYALHFNLQVERELFKDYLVNLAYVGTRGVKLTRFRTPNGGLNSIVVPLDPFGLSGGKLSPAFSLPPLYRRSATGNSRPLQGLGAFTIFDSSAASNYHSLQASVTKRFSHGRQLTAGYTWSHAIDDVSDIFDLAGAFNLPQDDADLRAERASANFDIRHRFVISSLSNVPFISRFNEARGAKGLLLGGWQFASISTYQTGQPFTVNTDFDVNGDGNLTDRLNRMDGFIETDRGPQRLILPDFFFRAGAFQNGKVGRNTFRARGVAKTDFTLVKTFRVKEAQSLVFRVEAFNAWNRTHFGIPVRILEAPSFGRSVNTSLPARQVQFALKYVF